MCVRFHGAVVFFLSMYPLRFVSSPKHMCVRSGAAAAAAVRCVCVNCTHELARASCAAGVSLLARTKERARILAHMTFIAKMRTAAVPTRGCIIFRWSAPSTKFAALLVENMSVLICKNQCD